MKLPRLEREGKFNTHGWGNGWAIHGEGIPYSGQGLAQHLWEVNSATREQAYLVFSVGKGKTKDDALVWDGMNEAHMSINKPEALQTCCSFVHTKARLAALLPSHVHSWILNAL